MGINQLREQWRLVPDEEIVRTAFAGRFDVSPDALAVVYEEFVRRELQPPDSKEATPAPPPASLARRFPFLAGAIVYYGSFVAIYTVMIVVTASPGADAGQLVRVVAMSGLWTLPPGLMAVWFMMRLFRGYQPDPEGYTRCGCCSHILRGLSEPRCPECGQQL